MQNRLFLNRSEKLSRFFKNIFFGLVIFGASSLLFGCAAPNLKAPCPDYGKSCLQRPINHWDDLAR